MKLIYSAQRNALKMLGRQLEKPEFSKAKFFILGDQNTFEHCLAELIIQTNPLQEAELLEIESGEANKTLAIAGELWGALLESHADRQAVIINLGGGVISDLGGFIAAAYKRGIRYVNIPTTLLGMVDAAIGGKTAVDMNGLKNQVGFFHQPEYTCIYPLFLETLPIRELKAGAAEMLKTALISKPQFWEELQKWPLEIAAKNPQNIYQTAEIKLDITKKDFKEQHIRKSLNFGHTLGHAIESFSLLSNKNPLLHGEAVALGMLAELYLSKKNLNFPEQEFKKIEEYIVKCFGTEVYTKEQIKKMIPFLRHDKKNSDSKIKACLLHSIGKPALDIEITEKEAEDALLYVSSLKKDKVEFTKKSKKKDTFV